MNNLALRVFAGVIGVTIIISAIVFSPWTFAGIFLLIALLTLREFYSLVKKSGTPPFQIWGLVFSANLFSLTFLYYQEEIDPKVFWIFPGLFALVFLYPLFQFIKGQGINSVAISSLGILYITIPFCLIVPLAFFYGKFSYDLILGILFAQWANDTGAYFVGKAFGKAKLFEKVSPNKTWEGAFGGLALSILVLLVFGNYSDIMNSAKWVGLGIVISIFGTLGDLVESLFKRSLNIKDSGSTIPGHGGFLDRFDGLILALPFALTYLILIG